jgi:ubiquinone/menaquinone biosynthesis C-methylase UbiE
MAPEAQYAHGHHDSVLRSHRWRTAQNSCAYLLPHLKPDMQILDIGCGPGNITCDLASLVPNGSVIGLDRAETVIVQAQELAKERGVGNVTFATGNIFKLPYADGTFDVVHAHQVLQHLGDPTSALKEMKRVIKKDTGIVAARDMSHFVHWPVQPELEEFRELFWNISAKLGTVPGIGCMFRKYAREAGLKETDVKITAGTWCYCEKEELEWWCGEYHHIFDTTNDMLSNNQ